jgi:chaperone BCS1
MNEQAGYQNGYSINSMLQLKMLDMVKHEDPLINGVLTVIALSVFTTLTTFIPNKLFVLWEFNKKMLICLYYKYFVNRQFNTNLKNYEFVVEEINMVSKSLNTLFPPMYWYVTNKIDLNKETPMKYSRNEDIDINDSGELSNININREVSMQKKKEFEYNQHKIIFSIEHKLETIYGSEQEIKKDNIIIKFNINVDNTKDPHKIFDDFCYYCMIQYAKNQYHSNWQQSIYINQNGSWDEQDSNNFRTIDSLILKEGQKEKLVDDLKRFFDEEQWCKDNGIPWSRGYLLYGPPGTGKTSFIKAISNYSERDIHYLILNNVSSDNELLKLLKDINYKKSVLVIEDIDCASNITHTRINKDIPEEETDTKDKKDDKKTGMTLSGLLNALDGIMSNHGRIMIVTSNNPKILDKALLRPGRIDIKECLSFTDHHQIREMYKLFFKKYPENNYKEIKENYISPADIIEIFRINKYDPENAIIELINFDKDNFYASLEDF